VLDACLLQASGGGAGGTAFLEGVARAGSLGRVRAYLDGILTLDAVVGDARRVGAVYRLRTRLMLVSGVSRDGKISTATTATRTTPPICPPSIHDVGALLDDVLFWDAREAGYRKLDDRYLAYIAWIACRTLFRRPPPFPVFNPNPLAYSKLLCQAIEGRDCAEDGHACFPMVAWTLASRVDSAAEQRALLAANTDEFGRRKVSLERGERVMHAWIEAQMLLVGNKLAVDDASRRGIVVGQAQEATLRTIRNLLFPCVLFCPYATLHKLFRLSTANRNDAWMLVAVCELFPDLTDLPSERSESDGAAEDGLGTELSRLLIDGVLSGDNDHDNDNDNAASSSSSFLFAARTLFQSLGGSFFHGADASQKNSPSNLTLWECLPSMLQAPPDRLEVATDFVLDVIRGSHSHSHTRLVDRNQHTSIDLISACVSLLDFDTRYRRYSECSFSFSKRSLDNAAKIVETLITESVKFGFKFDIRETLSEIETRSMNPWARLHCGLDFSADEARYILHTNPKPPHPQAPRPPSFSCSPQNTTLHQTLELAALGSIQRAELQELAAGYTSMTQFLADLQASIRCLFAVCTTTECMHLMTGLELFCTTLVIRTTTTTTTTTTTSTAVACACGTAMAVELCLKASATPTPAPSMIPDICQFCILRIEGTGTGTGTDDDDEKLPPPPALTTRLFSELLTHYANRRIRTPAVTAALETTLSTLSRRPSPFPPPLDATSILTQTFPPDADAPTPPFILALHAKLTTTL